MKINLRIDRLVLDGLPLERRDGHAVQAAVQQELARLMADDRFEISQTLAVTQTPAITLTNLSPSDIGHHIALSIHRGLTK